MSQDYLDELIAESMKSGPEFCEAWKEAEKRIAAATLQAKIKPAESGKNRLNNLATGPTPYPADGQKSSQT